MHDNQHLLDEGEHDTENYQGRGWCYLPKAEADNTNRGLDNFQYHAITSFNKCFITHWYHYLNSTGCERAQPIICRYDVTSTG